MAFWNRTAPVIEAEPIAPPAAPVEAGTLVICTGPSREFGGIALNYDMFTGEVFVRYYDREWKAWFSGWWQAGQVRPMVTGLTAADSAEIARALLATDALPNGKGAQE